VVWVYFCVVGPPGDILWLCHSPDVFRGEKFCDGGCVRILIYGINYAHEDTELGQLAKAHPDVLEICPPDDVNALVQLIAAATEAGKEARAFNAKARQYAEEFLDRNRVLTVFAEEIERIARPGDQRQ